MWYILDENNNVQKATMEEANSFYSNSRRFLKRLQTSAGKLSTVFLCLDHSFSHPSKAPVVFESMIFGGPLDQYQERYRSYNQAVENSNALAKVLEVIEKKYMGKSWRRVKKHNMWNYFLTGYNAQKQARRWFGKAQHKPLQKL